MLVHCSSGACAKKSYPRGMRTCLVAWVMSRSEEQTAFAAASPPRTVNDSIAPKPSCCLVALSWPGNEGKHA